MLKSSGAMAAATLTSRLLGMVREMVYARFMGDGWVAGAFQLAFTIPNLFRRLLGEGALTAAFIPVFKEKEKTHGEKEMWRAANAVISGLVIAASHHRRARYARHFHRAGSASFEAKTELMLRLLRVMFPYMLLGMPRRGVHGHAQCARTFLHPGHGRNDAQPGDDCVRALAGAAHGA